MSAPPYPEPPPAYSAEPGKNHQPQMPPFQQQPQNVQQMPSTGAWCPPQNQGYGQQNLPQQPQYAPYPQQSPYPQQQSPYVTQQPQYYGGPQQPGYPAPYGQQPGPMYGSGAPAQHVVVVKQAPIRQRDTSASDCCLMALCAMCCACCLADALN